MTEHKCSRRSTYAAGAVVASFACGSDLHLTKSEGIISSLLECDSNELLGTEWRKYVHPASAGVEAEVAKDLAAYRGGVYQTTHLSKSGDKLFLRSVTMTIAALGLMRGVTILEHIEPARTHVHYCAPGEPQPVKVRRPEDFVIDLKPAKES